MSSILIGIGTADGVSVCDHLARAGAFIIAEVSEGRVVSRSIRDRSNAACGNHATFVDYLRGCHAVLCGGIGQGAADSLAAHGIEPIVVAGKHTIDDALALYLACKLATTNERVCLCGGH
jgi:predicted Fe-Mo cluster-binding NifX family protein